MNKKILKKLFIALAMDRKRAFLLIFNQEIIK